MNRSIEKVAVIGAGTMGSGIAALCASSGCAVVLMDLAREDAERAVARLSEGRSPVLDDPEAIARIEPAATADAPDTLRDCDWICEAIIEDPDAKRSLLEQVEAARKDGSVVSSNTSGILLRTLTEGMPERLRRDLAVTHFFNPVSIMKLVELIPGADTDPDVIRALADFCSHRLDKGVVYGKDTVNFVANRVGCFWMLAGLLKAHEALKGGLTMEQVDALLSAPIGVPPSGLYGLIDLIGLDIMDSVARNLADNLPPGDPGLAFATLPPPEQAMVERGQLGRKTGGGFYRMQKAADGSRSKETYDLIAGEWRPARPVELAPEHREAPSLLFTDDAQGRFVWDLMSATLCYAAELVPEIADDIVNVDRALRWGFNWQRGPFELLDQLGPDRVRERVLAEGRAVPRMLETLRKAGAQSFYRAEGSEFLGTDGHYHPLPA